MKPSTAGLLCLLAGVASVATVGCSNPAVDVKIDQLPDEASGVEPSEFHRPGQPCGLCHGAYGGADPEMVISGTVFAQPAKGDELPVPVEGVEITVIDANGYLNPYPIISNCIGNFSMPKASWNPDFPLTVGINCPQPSGRRVMLSRIGRDGSCNRCHQGAPNQGSPGFLVCGQAYDPPTLDCKGVPR